MPIRPRPIPRLFVPALLALFASAATAHAVAADAANEIAVDAPRIQQYVQGKFPRTVHVLGGLFSLTARDPAVSIPADGDRLHMKFHASAGTPGDEDAIQIGEVSLSSGIRYDAQNQSLYLSQPSVDEVKPDSPGQPLDERSRELVNLWLQDYARKQPLYQLDPSLLANFGSLKVQSARIDGGRVIVAFDQAVALPEMDNATP